MTARESLHCVISWECKLDVICRVKSSVRVEVCAVPSSMLDGSRCRRICEQIVSADSGMFTEASDLGASGSLDSGHGLTDPLQTISSLAIAPLPWDIRTSGPSSWSNRPHGLMTSASLGH